MALARRELASIDVGSADYLAYLHNLERVGCPAHHRRAIVLADVEELFARKRLDEAVRHDFEWWRAEPQPIVATLLHQRGAELREERAVLLKALLDDMAPALDESEFWSIVPLTGAVLGALPPKVHFQVQEVCARWMQPARADPAGVETAAGDQVAMARSRERFRTELASILTPEQLEEFSIRFSFNAVKLREELRQLQPTPDEFRRIFRATDAMDREMQVEYGSDRALSQLERDRYLQRRNSALEQALGRARFTAYARSRS
jgi:hypothetical protein